MSVCDSYQEMISAQLDGALTADEREQLLSHLGSCEACRSYMAELAAIGEVLSNTAQLDVPDGFADGVMRRVRENARRVRKPSALRRFAPLAACAAVLAVVFAGGIGFGGLSGGAAAGDAAAPPQSTMVTADSYSDYAAVEEDEGVIVADDAYADEDFAFDLPTARGTNESSKAESLTDMTSAKGAAAAPVQLRVPYSDALAAWLEERGIPCIEQEQDSFAYAVDAQTMADFTAFLDESGVSYTQEADTENMIVLEN